MAKPRVSAGGGIPAILYTIRMGRRAGGLARLVRRMRSRNTCKTCALGMGGRRGGMVNEAGHFPEVCKKSLQAQASDMMGPITEAMLRDYPLARLVRLTSAELENLGRIAFPMIAESGDTHFRRISWDAAYDVTADALNGASPDETFFYSSGRASNEAAFLMQVVARAYGTGNINNCSYYCHSASGVALNRVYGSGTASVVLEDLQKTDLVVIAGANPASNHPRLITQLVNLRRRGGKVIVVNPMRELGLVRFRLPSDWRSFLFGSTISDLYLQPHVGSDVLLFKALLKQILEMGAVTDNYIERYTSGWEGVRADVEGAGWDGLIEGCGVDRSTIARCADMIAQAERGIMFWAMGLTHHEHGVDNVLALSNLALARGWLGRPGCGLLPIRGHSNVQGVGSVGVSRGLKKAFADRMEQVYGITQRDGQDTYASMKAAEAGRVKTAFLLGGNLFASNPDRAWAGRALGRIPVIVHASTKMNEGHVHVRGGTTVILPVLARDEEAQATTQESMFNYVRLSQGGKPSVDGEMRSEVEIIASLAERILPADRFDWSSLRSHERLRQAISEIVPGYGPLGAMDRDGDEFQIDGRTFHEPKFNTDDGKAHFFVTPAPGFSVGPDEFRLMTLRSEGQFNTVVYDEEDLYRGATRRDVVLMAEEDTSRLGIREGECVKVRTEAGQTDAHVSIADIRPGNVAMYYPEANVVVPQKIDGESGTPAFKSVIAQIIPAGRSIAAGWAVTG